MFPSRFLLSIILLRVQGAKTMLIWLQKPNSGSIQGHQKSFELCAIEHLVHAIESNRHCIDTNQSSFLNAKNHENETPRNAWIEVAKNTVILGFCKLISIKFNLINFCVLKINCLLLSHLSRKNVDIYFLSWFFVRRIHELKSHLSIRLLLID